MGELILAAISGIAIKTVAFILLIGVLVVIHEYGHYIMAKRGGVRVEEFAIGFGPVLARLFRQEETTFNLRALPLGGFVKMDGMEPGDMAPEGYNVKPAWTRAKIISAGVVINLIFGFVLMVLLGMTVGLPSDVVSVGVGEVTAKSAAERAGLKRGDTFVRVNDTTVKEPGQLTSVIRGNANKPIQLVVRRDGQEVPLTAVPSPVKNGDKMEGRLGFAVQVDEIWERHGLAGSIGMGWKHSYNLARGILKAITTKDTWKKRELGGPIAIAQAAGGHAERGLKYYLYFMAMFSVNLGVMNLLPLPVLDGGHLLLLGIEAVRRKRLSTKFVLAFQSVGVALLFMFFCFIMASDLLRAIGRG